MKSLQKGSIIVIGIVVMSIAIIGIGSYLLITELPAKNQDKQQEVTSQTYNNSNICISDCSPAGAKNCINTNSYSICNQDIINNCLKWSTPFSCPDNWQCQDGNCVNSLISTSSTDLNTSQPSSQQQTTPQCTTGVCCDSSKQKFKSSSTICQSNFNPQYGCPWGNELGGDVGIRYQDKYCSGTSANCNGLTKWRGWEVSEQCNTNEYCSDGKCVVSQVASLKCSDGTSYNQCSSQKPKYCQNGDLIDECSTCGCSTNKNCINNQCIEECTNECYSGQRKCSDAGYVTCGNYDSDSCLEWSSVTSCQQENICIDGSCRDKKGTVALIVDENTYNALSKEIGIFKSDIERDTNFGVSVLHKNWVKGSEIRNELSGLYQNGGLQGAIFIGNIPIMHHATKYQGKVYPSNPSDYYYQKLDTKDWIEETSDTIIQNMDQKNVYSRTIWTGRLLPPGNDSVKKIELLRNYFQKNHKYRIGEASYDGMLFLESQGAINIEDLNNTVGKIANYTNLYEQPSKVKTTYAVDASARKNNILEEIVKNYEITSFNVHGTPVSQWIGDNVYINKEDIIKNAPGSLFVALESCSNGNMENSEYIAGWYLFSGNSLLVKANSVDTFYIGWGELSTLIEYKLIAAGLSFGDVYKTNTGGQQSMLFGDPTLAIRNKNYVSGPKLTILDENIINLGDKSANQVNNGDILKTIRVKNSGQAILELSNYSNGYAWVDRSLDEGASYPYGIIRYRPTIEDISPPVSEITILPGETKNIYIVLSGKDYIVSGKYRDFCAYITNDPASPLFKIELYCNWYK